MTMTEEQKDPNTSALEVRAGDLLERKANEVLLVSFIVDDSSSIDVAGNTKSVIDGHNSFLARLLVGGRILVKTMFLNNTEEQPFTSPVDTPILTEENYIPRGNTPLFKRTRLALEEVVRETDLLRSHGQVVRRVVLIFTDGADNESGQYTATDVKEMVESMLSTGDTIVGGCALSDGRTDFAAVFESMGIPEQWIMVLRNAASVEEAMSHMGHTTSVSSVGAESFHHTSVHGFRRPSSSTPPSS